MTSICEWGAQHMHAAGNMLLKTDERGIAVGNSALEGVVRQFGQDMNTMAMKTGRQLKTVAGMLLSRPPLEGAQSKVWVGTDGQRSAAARVPEVPLGHACGPSQQHEQRRCERPQQTACGAPCAADARGGGDGSGGHIAHVCARHAAVCIIRHPRDGHAAAAGRVGEVAVGGVGLPRHALPAKGLQSQEGAVGT